MINEEGKHCNQVINDALDKFDRIDKRDRSLFVKLIHGTLEYQIQIDEIINSYSSVKVKKMKPIVRNVLRLTIYQILYSDKIPDSAAINEGVKLIKKSALKNLAGFVNAVSRKISLEKDRISLGTRALKYSVPQWMIELVDDTVGIDQSDAFFTDSLKEHGLSIRYIGSDVVSTLENFEKLTELDEWKDGKIIAQDYSSSQPIVKAELKNGDIVIDVCAAPGGKAIQASEHVGKDGLVYACDISSNKVDKIIQNIERLKVTNIQTVVADATKFIKDFYSKADCVIADLPCSGIGTISGKPDIKNRLSIDDCKSLAELQLSILNNVCDYVCGGGKLVYSTCTIDHYENEDNIRRFLDSHSNYELISSEYIIRAGADGFYIAVLRKKQ